MSVVFVLVFAAIILAGAFLIAFIWSVKNGQYEDTYTPSVRMLFDDPPVKETVETEKEKKGKSRSRQSQLAEKGEKGKSRSGQSQKDKKLVARYELGETRNPKHATRNT